jgi:hypothetical protein
MSSGPTRIRCREIEPADIAPVVEILKEGFPRHAPNYWANAFVRMAKLPRVPGKPQFGYLLEADGVPVGVLLVIFKERAAGEATSLRANIASWYVKPEYRSYAPILNSRAHAHPGVTFLQLTPARHVVPIIQAAGYRPYATGMLAVAALLCPGVPGARVRAVSSSTQAGDGLTSEECELLRDHQQFDCLSVVLEVDGRRHPFVFARRWRRTRAGWLPYARLIYCRSLEEFAAFAGPLGRYLAWRGLLVIFLDANEPLPGMWGRFLNEATKFYKGPHSPRLGDIAYTELSMFGG